MMFLNTVEFVIFHVFIHAARMKGDTPVNSTMSVGQARKLVEQLKIEASFCRIKVRQIQYFNSYKYITL